MGETGLEANDGGGVLAESDLICDHCSIRKNLRSEVTGQTAPDPLTYSWDRRNIDQDLNETLQIISARPSRGDTRPVRGQVTFAKTAASLRERRRGLTAPEYETVSPPAPPKSH